MRLTPLFVFFAMPATAFAQFGIRHFIETTLNTVYQRAGWDGAALTGFGWNLVANSSTIIYSTVPSPLPDETTPIGSPLMATNSSSTATNSTLSIGPFSETVAHTWLITDGMTGDAASFDGVPDIDQLGPGTGTLEPLQGKVITRSVQRTDPRHSDTVCVPPMATGTVQPFFHEHPVSVPFSIQVKIGGTFTYKYFRGNTTAQNLSVIGFGDFFRAHPDPHVAVIDSDRLYIYVTLKGEYTGTMNDSFDDLYTLQSTSTSGCQSANTSPRSLTDEQLKQQLSR